MRDWGKGKKRLPGHDGEFAHSNLLQGKEAMKIAHPVPSGKIERRDDMALELQQFVDQAAEDGDPHLCDRERQEDLTTGTLSS